MNDMDDDEITTIIETIKRYRHHHRDAVIKFIDPVDDKVLEELPLRTSNRSNFINGSHSISSDHLSSPIPVTEEVELERQLLKAKEEVRLIEARLSQPRRLTSAAAPSAALSVASSSSSPSPPHAEEDDPSDLSEITTTCRRR